ncbi:MULTISPECIES: porin [Prosthecochloris]|uniref:Porin domain-containing protein n=1 Tax=Prosthecochloris marina TaxID=2017681 RepID=A0A317T549_9CHLB|nr:MULTISPECIES: porin [Prosthecochloris]PWW81758.1 hypothetical protein CR164_07980 [Prosthecochloris marina]UZJ38454.1 porin [Prosthecochloris sp. SCSIO W1103]
MKKKILSLLCLVMIWALPSAVTAEETKPSVTVYGNLRYSFNYIDEDGHGMERWKGTDNVSRFGIKGSYGNEDIKAFVHLQVRAFADGDADKDAFEQRFFFGGFEGGFGKVTYGRMTNAYKFPGYALDPFYDLSRISSNGWFSGGGASYGLSSATNGFTDNALQYFSPNLNGFKLVGGIAFDDSEDNNQLAYLAGGSYSANGFTFGGVYADNPEKKVVYPNIAADGDAIRAYATYKGKGWKAGASYENIDVKGGPDNVNYFYLTGTAMLEEAKTDLSLSLGLVDDGAAEGLGITGGAFYNILDNAQIYAMASYADLDSDYTPYVLSVGAIYNFKYTVN